MDSSNIGQKIKSIIPKTAVRILLVAPPQVPENSFDIGMALKKRYPVFPPYGLGILKRRLHDSGYVCDILDLNYDLLFFLDQNKGAFDYSAWKDIEESISQIIDNNGQIKDSASKKLEKIRKEKEGAIA